MDSNLDPEWCYENCGNHTKTDLFFSEQTIEDLGKVAIWRLLCPFLTIADRLVVSECEKSDIYLEQSRNLSSPQSSVDCKIHSNELTGRGYYRTDAHHNGLPDDSICERLAMGIRRLLAHKYSANMILIYDEAWIVVYLMLILGLHMYPGHLTETDQQLTTLLFVQYST
jgi:hypothetical protein